MKDCTGWKGAFVAAIVVAAMFFIAWMAKGTDEQIIRFANIPAGTMEVDVTIFADILAEVQNYLNDSGELDFAVKFEPYVCLDYTTVIQALKFGIVEMARFGAGGYIIAHEECGAIPIVSEIKKSTGMNAYTGVLVVRQDSDIYGLAKCVDWSQYTIIFVAQTSTSGCLAPSALLKRAGIDVSDFGNVYYSGSHAASLISLVNGYGDIACVAANRYNTAMENEVFARNDLRTIAVTPYMPTCCIAIRPDFDLIPYDLLVRAWESVSEETALAYKLLGFVEVDDRAYDPIREIAELLD